MSGTLLLAFALDIVIHSVGRHHDSIVHCGNPSELSIILLVVRFIAVAVNHGWRTDVNWIWIQREAVVPHNKLGGGELPANSDLPSY